MVPKAGLEPAWISPHAPQTCVSTSSTTSAGKEKYTLFSVSFSREALSDGCSLSGKGVSDSLDRAQEILHQMGVKVLAGGLGQKADDGRKFDRFPVRPVSPERIEEI